MAAVSGSGTPPDGGKLPFSLRFPSRTDRLRHAIDSLDAAARADRILPGSTLGAWVAAQKDLLNALYVMEEGREEHFRAFGEQLQAVIDGAKAIADTEAQRARTEVNKLSLYLSKAELNLAEAQNKSVEAIGDGIAARIQGALVIREKAYNRTKHFTTTLLATAALLGTLLGGYAWSSHDHANSIEALLWKRCKASVVADKQGHLLCSPSLPMEGE